MKKRMTVWVIVAVVLIFAIYHREDVKFSVKFLGADVSLEVTDDDGQDEPVGSMTSPPVTVP